MKRFVAFARVSSREQQREGFSLDVQADALNRYAEREGGEIVKFTPVAETASDETARRKFNETVDWTIQHAANIDAILFYKVDRAIRNTHDLCKLEEVENRHGVLVEFTSQPFPHTPAGWMQVRNLANFATYQTQQQSLDVREGLERRVREGLFPQKAPFGYQNYRENGRSLVRVHPEHGWKVRRIFDLYAYHGYRIDTIPDQLAKEGIVFTRSKARFTRSKIGEMLQDRSYIGEVWFRDEWWPGTHEHLVDAITWQRVQVFLNRGHYQSHELLFGGELIVCGHCGKAVTGEAIKKQLRSGEIRRHIYYRCSRYNDPDHPRIRLRQSEIDRQLIDHFQRLRIEEEEVRDWFIEVLRTRTQAAQTEANERLAELNRRLTLIRGQQDELLNLRLLNEVEGETFNRKSRELRDREGELTLQIAAMTQDRHDNSDIAIKAFELSQTLCSRWVAADYDVKRRILEILCLNLTLDGATLIPTWRKPFDLLAKGRKVEKSRGDWI